MLTRAYQMGSRLAVMICADNLLALWKNPRDSFARDYFQGEEFERWFTTDPRIVLREGARRANLQTVVRQIRLRRREEVPSLQSRLDEVPITDPYTGKPQMLVCARCGKTVPKIKGTQRYCRDCRPLVDLELKKARMEAARKAYLARRALEPDPVCPMCGRTFKVTGPRQIYCKECAADRKRARARRYKMVYRKRGEKDAENV